MNSQIYFNISKIKHFEIYCQKTSLKYEYKTELMAQKKTMPSIAFFITILININNLLSLLQRMPEDVHIQDKLREPLYPQLHVRSFCIPIP